VASPPPYECQLHWSDPLMVLPTGGHCGHPLLTTTTATATVTTTAATTTTTTTMRSLMSKPNADWWFYLVVYCFTTGGVLSKCCIACNFEPFCCCCCCCCRFPQRGGSEGRTGGPKGQNIDCHWPPHWLWLKSLPLSPSLSLTLPLSVYWCCWPCCRRASQEVHGNMCTPSHGCHGDNSNSNSNDNVWVVCGCRCCCCC